MRDRLMELLEERKEEIVQIRRYLHENPELSFQEEKTAQYIADFYKGKDVEILKNAGNGNGMIVTITNAKGFHWDSGWKTDSQWLFPEQQTANLFFQIKQDIFNQLNSEPVTAHLLLAFTLYRDRNRQRFVVPSGKFSLPEVGICTTELQYSRGIRCLAPLRRPAFLLVTSQSTASTCPLDGAETSGSDGVFLHAFVQGSPEPAEMGISPVVQFDINLSDWDSFAVRAVSPGVCPGTPLTLSNPEQTGRRSIELQIDNLSLGNFRQRLPTGR